MPNHVSSRFTITGPAEERARLLATVHRTDGDGRQHFDFQTIIPMPEGMEGTEASSTVAYALWALGEPDAGLMGEGACNPLSFPWAAQEGLKDRETLLAWLRNKHPDALPQAERQIALKKACGHYNWYSWSRTNWGTKWNAYHVSVTSTEETIELSFQTAWNFPEPIFEKLEEMFPGLVFDGACYDEGSCFSGAGRFGASVSLEDRFSFPDKADPAHYELVHGHPMPTYEDEEG